jgi:hypothetical protein
MITRSAGPEAGNEGAANPDRSGYETGPGAQPVGSDDRRPRAFPRARARGARHDSETNRITATE